MNNLLRNQLSAIAARDAVGLMTHVVLGYPTLAESIRIAQTMAESGADIIELQIPFSDPVADGPTIMHACETAIRNGVGPQQALEAMSELTSTTSVPLLFMGYFNTLFSYGVEKFCRDAHHAGASGMIIPDIPFDEEPHEHYIEACRRHDLTDIRMVSPASTADRLRRNAELAEGFVYCVSRYGITGEHAHLDPRLAHYLDTVRQYVKVPLAVGFGISTPEHVRSLHGHADIAVVGSAVLNILQGRSSDKYLPELVTLLQTLQAVTHR